MLKLLLLTLFVGCSQLSLKHTPEILGPSLEGLKAKEQRYWKVTGGENVLRNTSVATLAIWIKPAEKATYPMDLIAVAVGNKKAAGTASRASLRINAQKKLTGLARSTDDEKLHRVEGPSIKEGKWQHVTLVIDYAQNKMEFYFDGQLAATKNVRFKANKTANTPSRSISIGSEDDGSKNYFQGELKHAGFWNRRLSEDEIKDLVAQFTNRMR